jgi:hypothetical protein
MQLWKGLGSFLSAVMTLQAKNTINKLYLLLLLFSKKKEVAPFEVAVSPCNPSAWPFSRNPHPHRRPPQPAPSSCSFLGCRGGCQCTRPPFPSWLAGHPRGL